MKVLLHVLLFIRHQQEFYHNAYFKAHSQRQFCSKNFLKLKNIYCIKSINFLKFNDRKITCETNLQLLCFLSPKSSTEEQLIETFQNSAFNASFARWKCQNVTILIKLTENIKYCLLQSYLSRTILVKTSSSIAHCCLQ